METDTELRKQHQRDAILRDRMRKAFDMAYDTDAALIVRWNPFFPRFNGHTIARPAIPGLRHPPASIRRPHLRDGRCR